MSFDRILVGFHGSAAWHRAVFAGIWIALRGLSQGKVLKFENHQRFLLTNHNGLTAQGSDSSCVSPAKKGSFLSAVEVPHKIAAAADQVDPEEPSSVPD